MQDKTMRSQDNQREKTPPMLLNEVSRLCMAVANRAHGEDQARM
jgi:hypothetical protein